MNVVVCVKQVPDTEIRIPVRDGRVVEEEIKQYVVNPYDEYAIEEGIRIKERFGEGKVTLITIGPDRAREALLTGLAMGADEAIHINDPALEGSDPYVAAKVLAAAIKKLDYDIILCGKQAVDDDSAYVGIALAELLDIPHVSVVTKLEISEDKKSARAEREVEGGKEVVETSLPAVITAQKGLNEPRYPSFRGIRMARKKPYHTWTLADLGLSPEEVGAKGAAVEVVEVTPPPERKAGKIIEGDVETAVKELVRLLREEAKVI